MRYVVKTFRDAGLEAKWTKDRSGAPIIVCRNPTAKLTHQRKQWWWVDKQMWDDMKKHGIVEGFSNATFLGDVFSIAR